MSAHVNEVSLYANGLALLAYLGLLAYVRFFGRLQGADPKSGRAFAAALAATAAWAGLALTSELWPTRGLEPWVGVLDVARYGLWLHFLMVQLRLDQGGTIPLAVRTLRWAALGLPPLTAVLLLTETVRGDGALTKVLMVFSLSLPVIGLLALEQLFRNLAEDSRWNAKPICLGLGCMFAFDVYLYSEALLFGQFDPDALGMRAAAHALATPFLFIASRRGHNWMRRLQVSRTAAFFSATLVLAGAYLLLMSAAGYYVRYFGGTWGRALQLCLLAAGLSLLGMLVFSGSVRSWLRVFVGKHFFSYRYDYREEWLRFTAMLSSNRSPQEMGTLIVQGLSKMVECPAGSLWTQNGTGPEFVHTVAWNVPRLEATEPTDSSLCEFLRRKSWVIDMDEFRSSPRRYGKLALPTWLLGSTNASLVVPLMVGDELLGFVVLARPMTALKLNWEVLDLLKTAGRQAAGYLAQMQATEALLEARKFEAFNRMSAFVVHDLKNIVAQLSLMLRNAERLRDNREFQQDMLLTVESSLEKMKRLMLQLREGATPPGGSRGVELAPILRRLEQMASAQGRVLQTDQVHPVHTRGHEDRLERVLGHLVQNALDATPPSGRVWMRVARHSGQVRVEVGDNGAGMSEEFVRSRLFRPFSTTKHSGMGIGSYESSQYIRELGGALQVASALGKGTLITVTLPLFEAERASTLLSQDAPS